MMRQGKTRAPESGHGHVHIGERRLSLLLVMRACSKANAPWPRLPQSMAHLSVCALWRRRSKPSCV